MEINLKTWLEFKLVEYPFEDNCQIYVNFTEQQYVIHVLQTDNKCPTTRGFKSQVRPFPSALSMIVFKPSK